MKFLYDAPGLLYKGALIVGDTHFGMEGKLRRRGIYDEGFSMRLFERLKGHIISHKARKLILLGDVKEDITTLDAVTEQILAKLSMLCPVTIVRGNHDGGIERCGNAEVMPAEGFVYGKLGLAHGHSWPGKELMMCDYLVMGHQHPMVGMTDSFGRKHTETAWVIAPPDEAKIAAKYGRFNRKIKLVLMPAFNPLVGSAVNLEKKEHLGPLLNNNLFKLNDALVFRLNGISLGRLRTIL